MDKIITRKCPNCGEDVQFDSDDNMTICEHCEVLLDIDVENDYELTISQL